MWLVISFRFTRRVDSVVRNKSRMNLSCSTVTGVITLQNIHIIFKIIRMLYMKVSLLDVLLRNVLQDSLTDLTSVIMLNGCITKKHSNEVIWTENWKEECYLRVESDLKKDTKTPSQCTVQLITTTKIIRSDYYYFSWYFLFALEK